MFKRVFSYYRGHKRARILRFLFCGHELTIRFLVRPGARGAIVRFYYETISPMFCVSRVPVPIDDACVPLSVVGAIRPSPERVARAPNTRRWRPLSVCRTGRRRPIVRYGRFGRRFTGNCPGRTFSADHVSYTKDGHRDAVKIVRLLILPDGLPPDRFTALRDFSYTHTVFLRFRHSTWARCQLSFAVEVYSL